MNLKLLTLAAIGAGSSSPACPDGVCTDVQRESSVLMQRLNRKGRQIPMKVAKQAAPVAKKDTSSMDLYQVAAGMLREGTTGDVLEFANNTLEELEMIVLPALMDGFFADKKLLQDMMTGFANASEAFAGHRVEVQELGAREDTISVEHEQCRNGEEADCGSATTCETERNRLWTIYTESEIEYKSIFSLINSQWCEETWGNRSAEAWRSETSRRFEHYIQVGEERITKLEEYEEWSTRCEESNHSLVDANVICDEKKKQLEVVSCQRLARENWASEQLDIAWRTVTEVHEEVSGAVRAREELRHLEFKSIKGVKCLLKHIVMRSLQACDEEEEPGEYMEIMGECETFWQVDVEFLLKPWNLTYPEVPEKPEKPHVGLVPCSDEYIATHYTGLVGFCFTSMPHCKACSEEEYVEEEEAVAEPQECSGGQVWNTCGSACQATCEDPHPMCTRQCMAMCQCPADKPLLQDGVCILDTQCAHHEDTENFDKHASTSIQGEVITVMSPVDNAMQCADKCNELNMCKAFRYFTSPSRICELLTNVQELDGVHDEKIISFSKKQIQEVIFHDFADQPELDAITFEDVDTDGDAKVSPTEFRVLMDTLNTNILGSRYEVYPDDLKQANSDTQFKNMDVNEDGFVDKEEAGSMQHIIEAFVSALVMFKEMTGGLLQEDSAQVLMQLVAEQVSVAGGVAAAPSLTRDTV